MVDITNQLAPYLIQMELERLQTTYNCEHKYNGDGTFSVKHERVVPRRIQSGSSFEPPQDSDPIVNASQTNQAVDKLMEETWVNSNAEEARKTAQKKLNSRPKELPRKIDL